MARQLTVVQPLPPGDHGPAFRGSPTTWLPHARATGPGQWQVVLEAAAVERAVRCRVGDPWTTREGVRRRLRWEPLPEEADVLPVEKWLPALDGELFLVGPAATPSLALAGDVEVPFGMLGEAVDALLLGRVMQTTAAGFLRQVAERLPVADPTAQPVGSGAHHRS